MTATTRRAAPPRIDSEPADTWREQSECRKHDPELFYPLGGYGNQRRSGLNLAQENAAKAVCNRCPVRAECLKDALKSDDEWGIWGGLNEDERRALRQPKVLSPAMSALQVKSAEVRAARMAAKTHCDAGHELTEENTYSDRGQRVCRTCRQEYQRQYRATHKAVSS